MALLTSIALPYYGQYVQKSRTTGASGDLLTLGVVLENLYQRTLAYPAGTPSSTSLISTYISNNNGSSWNPSESAYFAYSATITSTTYTLTATGISGLSNSGCVLTISNANVKTVSGSNCGGFTW